MQKRKFGNTGLMVSPLGFGTVKVGRNFNVKNASPDGFALPSDNQVLALIDKCMEMGINFVDTAPSYGISEERLGKLLGARRNNLILTSKVGEELKGQESEYIFTKEHTKMSVHRSLKRLKTDRLEMVMVHCNAQDVDNLTNTAVLETLQRLKEQGDILSFGASVNTLEGGQIAAKQTDGVIVAFNAGWKKELPTIETAAKLGKAVIIKKGLYQGHLNKVEGDGNPLEICMDAVLNQEGVTSLVFGTLNMQHLEENIKAANKVII